MKRTIAGEAARLPTILASIEHLIPVPFDERALVAALAEEWGAPARLVPQHWGGDPYGCVLRYSSPRGYVIGYEAATYRSQQQLIICHEIAEVLLDYVVEVEDPEAMRALVSRVETADVGHTGEVPDAINFRRPHVGLTEEERVKELTADRLARMILAVGGTRYRRAEGRTPRAERLARFFEGKRPR